MAYTHGLSTNNYGPAKIVVATSAANGTHVTLTSAMADAVSGDTIVMRNSVTENVTLTAGVNITAWTGDDLTPTISITGKLSFAAAGTCTISNVRLTTNSDNILSITGSAASIVNLQNCYLNCSTTTGISYTTASTSSQINITGCKGNLGTTGISFWSSSSTGTITTSNCIFTNTGGSSTVSTNSAGTVNINGTNMASPVSSTSTGSLTIFKTNIDCTSLNATAATFNGSGVEIATLSRFTSGSAVGISSASANTFVSLCDITSTNTNAISGAGTVRLYNTAFLSSFLTNVTTQLGGAAFGLTQGTAPSAGCIGEQIRSYVGSGAPITLTSPTAQNITSIALTPGIWDVSALPLFAFTGASSVAQASITPTTGTISANTGDQTSQISTTALPAGLGITLAIPSFRVTLSANTTYYLVAAGTFSTGSATAWGRISATRVG